VSAAAIDLGWSFFGPLLERLITIAEALPAPDRATVSAFVAAVTASTDR
jgi:hypothetical protein